MYKIYVASSWRNQRQQNIVKVLRDAGHEVYDFKNPREGDTGFQWSEIDPAWQSWTKRQYAVMLHDPIANKGFANDFKAMQWADLFVGVQPFGRSASMEMGWAAGQGKKTILLLENGEPELMVKMFDYMCCEIAELLALLGYENPPALAWR